MISESFSERLYFLNSRENLPLNSYRDFYLVFVHSLRRHFEHYILYHLDKFYVIYVFHRIYYMKIIKTIYIVFTKFKCFLFYLINIHKILNIQNRVNATLVNTTLVNTTQNII